MKKNIFIAITILVLFVIGYLVINWKSMLLGLAGFNNPKIENAQTVKSWNGLNTEHALLVVASTKINFSYLQENIGVPGIIVFDKEGVPIISSRGDGCQITARNKLKDLGSKEFERANEISGKFLRFDSLFDKFSVIDKSVGHNKIDYDYTVVYTWAKYLPKHSRDMMEAVNQGLADNKAKVLLISLNLDYMDMWTSGTVGDEIDID